MRSTRETSVAKYLKSALDVVYYVVLVLAALKVLFIAYGLVNPASEFEEASIQVGCEVEALDISFSDIPRDGSPYVDPHLKSHDAENYFYNVRGTTTSLRFRTHSRLSLGLYLMLLILWYGLFLFVAFNLRNVVNSLTLGTPFTLENASRLRMIGLAVILVPPLLSALLWLFDRLVIRNSFSLLGEPLSVDVWPEDWAAGIFLGFVVLAISEVFRLGVRMKEDLEKLQEEQSLTI